MSVSVTYDLLKMLGNYSVLSLDRSSGLDYKVGFDIQLCMTWRGRRGTEESTHSSFTAVLKNMELKTQLSYANTEIEV